MLTPERLGLVILIVGGVVGLVVGGPVGLAVAAVCLVVGLVVFVASEARGAARGAAGAHSTRQTPQLSHQKAKVLVLVKDVHARPLRAGKFQEIRDSNERGLEFEVFINCWLVNETDAPLRIVGGIALTLRAPDGSTRLGERIISDLEAWRLGNLIKDEWDADVVRAAQEQISELNATAPLECGVPREGWLHFRLRNVTPSGFKTGTMELSITDSSSSTHVGVATGPRHVPGRIWPAISSGAGVGRSKGVVSP